MGRISLVVDDEPSVRKYISAILKRENFQTVEAGDGAHGLRIVQELGDEVALIVSDIHMPNGDGVAFAQAVKAEFPAVPIILVSGQAEQPHREFGFVRKPFQPSALLEAVRELMADSLSTVPSDC
jgi:CheY-like chemotaxis protein